ncbi:MAG: hypothetical protein WKF66_18615 [Pedobacter sp.]
MRRSFIFRTCLFFLLFSAVCLPLSANLLRFAPSNVPVYQQDDQKQEDKKQDRKKKEQKKPESKKSDLKDVAEKPNTDKSNVENLDKPDIKEVPKSRKQSRPAVVSKPNVKIKPIKIMRPKIKKP